MMKSLLCQHYVTRIHSRLQKLFFLVHGQFIKSRLKPKKSSITKTLLLIMMDTVTIGPEVRPLPNKTAKAVAKCHNNIDFHDIFDPENDWDITPKISLTAATLKDNLQW